MTDMPSSPSTTQVAGICRFCHAGCSLLATISDGRIRKLIGDRRNPVYGGYSCVKGRHFHDYHYAPDRVRHPLRRNSHGTHERVGLDRAYAEVAARLQAIISRDGPRAVALYGGTFSHFCPASVMARDAFMDAIGSPMRFSNATIDQPGKPIAMAMHGRWGAGPQAFADADVCLLVGANPLVSMWGGIPAFNPAKRLHEAQQRGLKLIVIDPRRTETARKASLHLQCLPGVDAALLASLMQVALREGLYDRDFVARETRGFEALRDAIAPFTPERIAPIAGLRAAEITDAARLFMTARRGNATSGTGPSMAPHGVLMEYLVLCLNTLGGRWIRAGEPIPNRGVLFRAFSGIARTEKPRAAYGFGEKLRVRGLSDTAAGLPTAALSDEILRPGPGQVKALIVVGGNPLASWPNREKTRRALETLELLVVLSPEMSGTAELAHYVIGPRFGFETPAISFGNEGITVYGLSIGFQEPYAQYQPQLIEPPEDSEVVEDWRVFYELGRHMGLSLSYRGESFDMSKPPTTDELLARFVRRSRIPLDVVKSAPAGALYPDPAPLAEPAPAEWPYRLELANAQMIRELVQLDEELSRSSVVTPHTGDDRGSREFLELKLVSRREHAVYNSVGHRLAALARRRPFNPAYLNPEDAAMIGVVAGDPISIESAHASVRAIAQPAPDIRRGVLSIAHCFPDFLEEGARQRGTSTAALIDDETEYDPISGLPRMSAVPVRVRPLASQ